MVFKASINRIFTRAAVIAIALPVFALLGFAAVSNYVVGALTDERLAVPKSVLADAGNHFTDSARLNARLAEAELTETERNLALAEFYAQKAASLSPWDHNYQTLLAAIKEAGGNRVAAEEHLLKAIALAPNNADVRWRFANLLLRQGKLSQSLDEFRIVNASGRSYLPATLALVWQSTGGKADALEAIAGDDTDAKLYLAQFLLKQSRVQEAGKVFRSVDRRARLEARESQAFLNSLVAEGQIEMARYLWGDIVGGSDAPSKDYRVSIWNGSFESDILKSFDQFDWAISSNDYARVTVSAGGARTGARALMIEFLGRDTTRLDGEIKQLVLVRPGARYRLECFAKSEGLKTPSGPRVTITKVNPSELLAESVPVKEGSTEWQKLIVDFVAPDDVRAIIVAIERVSKFNYDDPTWGTVRFDDFTLTERKEGE